MIRSQLNSYSGADPIWGFVALIGSERYTGEAAVGIDPRVRLFAVDGRVYFAEREGDAPIGTRLINCGAVTPPQLEKGSVQIGDTTSLARLFQRDATIDRDAVELTIELATESLLVTIANKAVGMPEVFPLRQHSSGVHHWMRSAVTVPVTSAVVEDVVVEEAVHEAAVIEEPVVVEPVVVEDVEEDVVVEDVVEVVVVEDVVEVAEVAEVEVVEDVVEPAAIEEAVHEAAVIEEPVAEAIVVVEVVTEEAAVDIDEPAFDEPFIAEFVVEEPVVEEPVVEEFVVEEPVAELVAVTDLAPSWDAPADVVEHEIDDAAEVVEVVEIERPVVSAWSLPLLGATVEAPVSEETTIEETTIEGTADEQPTFEYAAVYEPGFDQTVIDESLFDDAEATETSFEAVAVAPEVAVVDLEADLFAATPLVAPAPVLEEVVEVAVEEAPVVAEAPVADEPILAAMPTLASLTMLPTLQSASSPLPAPAVPAAATTPPAADLFDVLPEQPTFDTTNPYEPGEPPAGLPKLASAPISMTDLAAANAVPASPFGDPTHTLAAVDIWELVDVLTDDGHDSEQELVGAGGSEKRNRGWLRSRKS